MIYGRLGHCHLRLGFRILFVFAFGNFVAGMRNVLACAWGGISGGQDG
jgi:hypothetical protein